MDTTRARLSLDGIESPRAAVSLAPAHIGGWLESLEGKRIAIFNNGKMDPQYVIYQDFYPVTAGVLQDLHATCCLVTRDILSEYDHVIEEGIVGEIRGFGADGVVLGICDAGATYRTLLLARRLIQEGFPCVLVCNDLGIRLARTMASRAAPNLPILHIPARLTSITTERLRSLASEIASNLRDGPRGGEEAAEADWTGYRQVAVEGELSSAEGDGGFAFRPTGPHADFGEALYDRLSDDRLGDGLPVVVPTAEKVARMLELSSEPAEAVLARNLGPGFVDLTVREVAVNAVMAGCKPAWFPIVLTAFKALTQERYGLTWTSITTHPAGNMVLVSGPHAREVGIASGLGCLGPGFRANATIGRTVTLAVINSLGAVPGKGTLSLLGSPAQYSYCFAENLEESPWPGLNEELCGRDSTVVVTHRVEGPRNILEHRAKEPEAILESIARTATSVGSNNAYVPAELIVVLNPEHAWLIADHGWSKTDVRRFLYERIRNRKQDLAGHGVVPIRPKWMSALSDIPVVERPEDIFVVVAGGWGHQSMVALPWGWARLCWEKVP